jgi:hypothetical protein
MDHTRFVELVMAIREETARRFPRNAELTARWMEHLLDVYRQGGERDHLIVDIDGWQAMAADSSDFHWGEYLIGRLSRLREALLSPAELAELEDIARRLVADMLAEGTVTDPDAARWAALDALLASHVCG